MRSAVRRPEQTGAAPGRIAVLALLLGTVLAGCTHTQPLHVSSPAERAAFNAQAEGTEARIALVDGTPSTGHSVRVAPDVTRWTDLQTGPRSAPTSEIASIRYVDRGRGALEGAGLGLVGGGLIGGLVGTDGGAEPDEMEVFTVTPEQILLGFAIIGTVIGAVVGMARGHRTIYRVSPQRPRSDLRADSSRRSSALPPQESYPR